MTLKSHCTTLLAVAVFACSFSIAATAEGQLAGIHPSFYGSGEADTKDNEFYLLGMYLGVSKLGWSPYANVNGYRLNYVGPQSELSAFSPTFGFAHAARKGGYSLGAGYTWSDSNDPSAPGSEGGGASGIHAAAGAYRNGKGDRPLRIQLLSNYNLGSRYVWSRLRSSVPLSERVRVGAELVGQGGGKNGSYSNSFKLGPTVEYQVSDNLRSGAVAGYKSTGGTRLPDGRESTPYFKLEFSYSPF